MRHRKLNVKLGRTSSHRKALLSALVCGLIERKRIVTTLPKANLARRDAEKLISLARRQTLAARRQALAFLRRPAAVRELFENIAPQCGTRAGGYTRIVKAAYRRGDGAPMALLEWTTVAPHVPVDSEKEGTTDEKE